MPSAQRTIVINRSPADVFAFVADGARAREWRPGVLDVEHASGEGSGAVYRQGVKGPGGRRVAADYQVTDYEPPRRLAFKAIAGPVRPTGEYRLDPSGEGTTLSFSLDARLNAIQNLLMGRMVQRSMDAEMAALDRLKAVLEG
jgi:uncharacterized protein YndB with AHSA1/START domain